MQLQFIFQITLGAGSLVPLHTHAALEMVYFVAGSGQMLLDGQVFPIRPGAYAVIPAGIEHDQQDSSAVTSICLSVIDSGVEPFAGYWLDHEGKLGQLCRQLLREMDHRAPAYQTIATGLLLEIAGHIERQATCTVTSPTPTLVTQALTLIENADGQLSVEELADRLYVSMDYLRHILKEKTSMSPIQHLIRARIGKARELLNDPALTITLVAEHSGFESVFYFSRLFKKVTGLSPSEYRTSMSKYDKYPTDSDMAPTR